MHLNGCSRVSIRLSERAKKLNAEQHRVMLTLDPKSQEGQEFARLLAPDIPRQVAGGPFRPAFGSTTAAMALPGTTGSA